GVTLMAPDVRYPDHNHPPEEVYLVLTEGEWRQEAGPWFSPGVGGSFYNRPGITHAMRSSGTPLFALWALRA
ncbi:MAG TPA: dimethylsulfonioproprionate lyase family protein, partial [Stellaceae bacterium]|nr:dimethylsulfonioproprionate lyase family protein [Stellaceae bacterium]